MGYATAILLFSHLYVPFIATLAFSAGLILLAFRRDVLRPWPLLAGAAGVAGAAALAALYFWEPIQVMTATVYPGHRTTVAGGGVPVTFVLAHFFPHFISDGRTAFYWNDLEIGTGGSCLCSA